MDIKQHLVQAIKKFRYKDRPIPRHFLHEDVPYFSQWESPELVEQILAHKISAKDDPNWKKSGAETKSEYEDWSWAACGMACTKMILAYTGKEAPLVELGKKCAEYGGYQFPLASSPGLLYKPYLNFVKQEFGWDAHIVSHAPLNQVFYELSKGNFVIVSVTPMIRKPESMPKSKGGHLVLLLGYDLDKREIYFHNPSGASKEAQANAVIGFGDFEKFFSGRGLSITL
jgi:hypothetical protein